MFGRTGAQPWIRQCTHPQGARCRVVRSLRRGDALLVARAFISWWALAEEAHLQRVDNADPGSRKRILRTWCTAETARAPRQRIGREGVSGGVRGLCGRVRKALLSPGRAAGFHRINSLPRRTCDPLRRHESEIDRTRLTSGDDDVESKCHRGVGRGEGRCPKDQRAIRWTHGYRRDPQRCREEPLIVRGCASAAFRCEDGRRTRRNRSKTCFGAAPNKRLAGSVGQRHVIHRSRPASPSSQHGSCTDTRTSQPW